MRWSPRIRIPILHRLLTLNISRRGASTSLKLGPVTFNSRGTYSINGPSVLDFRGKWKRSEPRTFTSVSPSSGKRRQYPRRPVCGAVQPGVTPCKLQPHDGGWHIPVGGEDPWRATWRNEGRG